MGRLQEFPKNEHCHCSGEASAGGTVFFITSSALGSGSQELGEILMRSFIYVIKEHRPLPARIFFLNSGVYLTTEGSTVLEDLLELEKMGVAILSCGTCLDYYRLKEKLQVGKITNMYDTVESLCAATKCISL